MATLLLSAAGAAAGSAVGGSVLGLSMTAAGRFVGASLGRRLDDRLLGMGSDPVETGRTDRIRMTGAGEGDAVPRVWGRVKLGGHVIWATQFQEHVTTEGGGKGRPAQPQVRRYSYSVSLAIALCQGEIAGVTRVWADGVEIALSDLDMRVYVGSADQVPDPKMEAIEGTGTVPAYRGTAYVVIEDLLLERFGNRVPQFSFEVVRHSADVNDPALSTQAVALMPGSGEYALATTPVHFDLGAGETRTANVNTPSGQSDLETSLDALAVEVPNCAATSLIVSWFGDDLRCGSCTLQPLVEQTVRDGSMPWTVAGVARSDAGTVPQASGRAVYGGTPADASVLESIAALKDAGQAVMFYPFILMTQQDGNGLADPWTGAADQPALPWRGRITLSVAPGLPGSPDQTAAADTEIAAFFGTAQASDFTVSEGSVSYSGPNEWSYRRFILHYAALCAAAGGVDSFCIGSEMRGLTQLRGASGFAAVAALRSLASEARTLLGPAVKIGYAADWSEYFGYHPQDGSGDVFFHLDPLWADADIDFIGIDNYMPLSDWRDGSDHADAGWGDIRDRAYLEANIEGGEGYDWYYASEADRDAQVRTPISDGAHGEDWVFRYKDIRNWWSQPHHDRPGGVRDATPTDWVPQSKPIWFTEMGCAAIDKGTNAPNLFQDPKSSESALPPYSNGGRDDALQRAYLAAMQGYWTAQAPTSGVYGAPMIHMSRAFVWAWDARPYPWFPGAEAVWSDGANHHRGHWITGRLSAVPTADVLTELVQDAGGAAPDVSEVTGILRGYVVEDVADTRSALQPLLLAQGLDAVESGGALAFRPRTADSEFSLVQADLAVRDDIDGALSEERAPAAELPERVRIKFIQEGGAFDPAIEEAAVAGAGHAGVSGSDSGMVLTRAEARQTAERWLHEARVARDTVRFGLPLSYLGVAPGQVLSVESDAGPVTVRVDRVELGAELQIDATRVAETVYAPSDIPDEAVALPAVTPAAPVFPVIMDLPLMSGDEEPHAPHIAVAAKPWPGTVAVYSSASDSNYALDLLLEAQSLVGVTQSVLPRGPLGTVDLGPGVDVKMTSGTLSSIDDAGLLAGGNLFAIGDGTSAGWELFQARDASLIASQTWRLEHRLRGQFGTDAEMPEAWPAGSYVVALNGIPSQIPLLSGNRGVNRHYRIGPASQGYDHSSFAHLELATQGIGLRPYRPVHLRARPSGGDEVISWVRRSRIDGDTWEGLDVPLGEETETYLLRVEKDGAVLREATTSAPTWSYTAAMQASDGGGVTIQVAQVSARFGPGPFAELSL